MTTPATRPPLKREQALNNKCLKLHWFANFVYLTGYLYSLYLPGIFVLQTRNKKLKYPHVLVYFN